ncbi:MAG: NUDIX domain-containing protein [Candidatus Methanomethylophilaceae archaeon]|nr:NUDIX domain-containing protein [Candidatus Methanomethylophilaceae archaeon]
MSDADCGFTRSGHRFRYRAAAIIVEEGNMLLMGNDRDGFLYTVGGAVQLGESAEDAVRRECMEETGAEYEPDRLVAVQEEFFDWDDGTGTVWRCQEVVMYFLMVPRGTMELPPHRSDAHGAEEHTVWVPLDDLHSHLVVPGFIQDVGSWSGPLVHRVCH